MKTKEELLAMSHEELIEYTCNMQNDSFMAEYQKRENESMREILAAIGIIYEAYKK